MKYIKIFTLLLINIVFINGQCDFSKIYNKFYYKGGYTSGPQVGMKVVIAMNNGIVHYLTGTSYSGYGFSISLANTNAYPGVSSNDSICQSSLNQPFSVGSSKVTFFDSRSFTISDKGEVSFLASQTGAGLPRSTFNISVCSENILFGMDSMGNAFTFYLQLGALPSLIGSQCTPLVVSKSIVSQWKEDVDYYQINVNITNSGQTALTRDQFTINFDDSKVRSCWSLDKVSPGVYRLPTYQTSLQPNQVYQWGYISSDGTNLPININ